MLLITSAFPSLKRLDEDGQDVGSALVGECIRSWQANGFRVLSVHNAVERDRIGEGFPGVEYRFVDEELGPGARKTPSFAALFADLPQSEPVGLINADIFMVPVPGLAERLAAVAADSTVVMHRWDVPSLKKRRGNRFDLGVDLLAFTPARIAPALERFTQLPYQLGVPWWDYALPVAASLYAPLALADDPVLLHHIHDIAWNEDEWHRFAKVSAGYLAEMAMGAEGDPKLLAELRRRLRRIEIEHYGVKNPKDRDYSLAELTIRWIQVFSEARPISLVAGMQMTSSGRMLDDPTLDELETAYLDDPAIEGAAPSEMVAIRDRAPKREFLGTPKLALYREVSTKSSAGQIVAAGFRDVGQIFRSTGKLLERRLRRKLRGYG